eukprot:5066816-Amphidinium_carterae.1
MRKTRVSSGLLSSKVRWPGSMASRVPELRTVEISCQESQLIRAKPCASVHTKEAWSCESALPAWSSRGV